MIGVLPHRRAIASMRSLTDQGQCPMRQAAPSWRTILVRLTPGVFVLLDRAGRERVKAIDDTHLVALGQQPVEPVRTHESGPAHHHHSHEPLNRKTRASYCPRYDSAASGSPRPVFPSDDLVEGGDAWCCADTMARTAPVENQVPGGLLTCRINDRCGPATRWQATETAPFRPPCGLR